MAIDPAALAQWFGERPIWVSDALELLLAKGGLSSADLQSLAKRCQEVNPAAKPKPVAAASFAPKAAGQVIRLKSISEPKGIEALNPRVPLAFGPEAVTIVYGHNGAGKSGYIRILNNVCGSKNRRVLLNNVFEGISAQSCKIAYEISGSLKELTWAPAQGQQTELAALEIYDTECGHVYVTAENEVALEPWLLGVLQQLIDACGHVDAVLRKEADALVSALPAMPAEYAGTTAAVWYASLSAKTSAPDVAKWSGWTDAQQQELATLQARFLEKNPADQAKTLRARAAGIQKFVTEWRAIAGALSVEAAGQWLTAKNDAATKRKAASEDAEKVFADAPLDGVGLESWKLLWEQARAYSAANAYPENAFPVVTAGARCVLCQQTLDEAAKLRLAGFERFVKGELETLAKQAEQRFGDLTKALPSIPSEKDFTDGLAVLAVTDDQLSGQLLTYRSTISTRSGSVIKASAVADLPPMPESGPIDVLAQQVQSLETQAKAFDEDAKRTDKVALRKLVREAEARKWVNDQKAAVAAEVTRLQKVAALDAARRQTDTMALSKKKAELSQVLVSEAFIKRFIDELKKLGASRIGVDLVQTRTAKGHVYHQIQLRKPKVKAATADVLSEGERRVVSLAAFLADVEGIEANTPFVFDDPISSLDQEYEEAVVARLVALAKKRQVIVFTHRLSLLTMLDDALDTAGMKPAVVGVNREPWGTGQPGEPPFPARKPKQALNALNDAVSRAQKVLNEQGQAAYEMHAKAICRDFRIMVERLVEESLLGGVVLRFRRSVQTDGRIAQLGKIQPKDCQLVEEMMTKYSRYEHSQSAEAPVTLPTSNEIATDIVTLQTWLREYTDRKVPAVT